MPSSRFSFFAAKSNRASCASRIQLSRSTAAEKMPASFFSRLPLCVPLPYQRFRCHSSPVFYLGRSPNLWSIGVRCRPDKRRDQRVTRSTPPLDALHRVRRPASRFSPRITNHEPRTANPVPSRMEPPAMAARPQPRPPPANSPASPRALARPVYARHRRPGDARLRLPAHRRQAARAFLLESVEGASMSAVTPSSASSRTRRSSPAGEHHRRRSQPAKTFQGDIFAELKQALSGHTPARLAACRPLRRAVGFLPTMSSARSNACPRSPSTNSASRRLPHVLRPGARIRPRQEGDPPHRHADLRESRLPATPRRSLHACAQAPQAPRKRLARALPSPARSMRALQRKPSCSSPRARPAASSSPCAAPSSTSHRRRFQCVLSQRFDCVPASTPSTSTAPAHRQSSPTCTSSASAWMQHSPQTGRPSESVILSEGRSPKSKDLRLNPRPPQPRSSSGLQPAEHPRKEGWGSARPSLKISASTTAPSILP